jgi:hypothetical protein
LQARFVPFVRTMHTITVTLATDLVPERTRSEVGAVVATAVTVSVHPEPDYLTSGTRQRILDIE